MSIPITRKITREESDLAKRASRKAHDQHLQAVRSTEAHLPKDKRTKFLK
jgi:hypothetical protein